MPHRTPPISKPPIPKPADLAARAPWLWRAILAVILIASLAGSAVYANKSVRAFAVLNAARSLDMPETGTIRAWMTLGYVADTYAVERSALARELALPETTPETRTLRRLAVERDQEPLSFILSVQRALASLGAGASERKQDAEDESWMAALSDEILSALLVYGYPVLAVVLFLGALGVPVPAGPLTTVAGTLALQGRVDATVAVLLAIGVSVVGDLVGYGLGRAADPAWLTRWGRWIGYTPANRARVDRLFRQWGGVTLLLTRSLIAAVGVVASVLAGTARYGLGRFFAYSVAGRALWTGAYFGLGYSVGTDFEAASGFLGFVSLTLLLGAVAAAAALGLWRSRTTPHKDSA